MPLVIDASVSLNWALQEQNPLAETARERLQSDDALVPALWWFEVRNGLVVNERRKRISQEGSALFLDELARFPIAIDYSSDEIAVMALARRHRLTVYDAAYLELALRESLPLATLDAALAEAARREGVRVIGDAAA